MNVLPLSAARRRGRFGFTMIEMMVTVLVLSIAAAIVGVGLGAGNVSYAQTESAARQVMADLIYAQNRAIATQQDVYVTFNTASSTQNGVAADTYALCSALPSTFLTNPMTQSNYTNSWSGKTWSISSVAFGGQKQIYFDELGTPWECDSVGGSPTALPAGGGTVTVSNGSYSATITIQPSTGDITVQ
jgi:prepilin-type N-terminal cleavage/methylation domain-containing protein